jgi:hypothetical protein
MHLPSSDPTGTCTCKSLVLHHNSNASQRGIAGQLGGLDARVKSAARTVVAAAPIVAVCITGILLSARSRAPYIG